MKELLVVSGYLDSHPMGGVTMHVHRLLKRLIEPHVADYVLCDYKRDGIIKQLSMIKAADVMHIHASNPYLKLLYVISGKLFMTTTLITLHGKYGIYNKWKNLIHKLALKWCDVPILINRESYDAVKSFNKDAVFIPAFIPPIEDEEVLSPELRRIIMQIKEDGNPLFVTNASRRAIAVDGKEIYGIGFLIAFFASHNAYNLVILDPNNEYAPLYENKMPRNVRFFSGENSFCGLIKLADAVIRNTSTDGDSFSVKEALFLHKPVLATDVVSRPEGTILFKYNDSESLENGINLLHSISENIALQEPSAVEAYLGLYDKLGVISSL